jgi:TetR/AcrR family transcriptional regulator
MSSKEKTISAAIDIFSLKGKHGARMEEIAKEAGVNKSTVYYYFGSKENLYREVLKKIYYEKFRFVFDELQRIQSGRIDHIKRAETIIRAFSKAFSENPNYTTIINNALTNESQDLQFVIRLLKAEYDFIRPEKLVGFFEEGISNKAFRNIDTKQTIISIVGVAMIFFIGRPIIEIMLGLDLEDEDVFLDERQESLIDLLLYGIVNRPE